MVLSRASHVLLGTLALLAPPVELRAGTLSGQIELRRPPRPIEARPATAEGTKAPTPDPLERRRSVVFLQTAPQGAFESGEPAPARIDQRLQAFVPSLLAIRTGTTVEFPNSDRTYHNVFSLSKGARFDLGRYGRGRSKVVRFDHPGVVRVFCDIHSHMSAFILVFAHRYFATADPEGRYRMEGVPPGTYTVVVWNDGEERESGVVTVPADGTPVTLDFVVR